MAATLDGIVAQTGAVFEAKFMLPGARGRGGGREAYGATPAQHVGGRRAITGRLIARPAMGFKLRKLGLSTHALRTQRL
jgi:hypothetical protein